MRRQKGVCFVFIPFFVTSNGVVGTFITITYELGKFIKCLGIVWWLSFKDIGVLHFTSFHDEKIVASRWDNYSVGHRCPHNKPFIITKLGDVRFVEWTGQRLGINLYQAQCLIESDVLFRGQRDINIPSGLWPELRCIIYLASPHGRRWLFCGQFLFQWS